MNRYSTGNVFDGNQLTRKRSVEPLKYKGQAPINPDKYFAFCIEK